MAGPWFELELRQFHDSWPDFDCLYNLAVNSRCWQDSRAAVIVKHSGILAYKIVLDVQFKLRAKRRFVDLAHRESGRESELLLKNAMPTNSSEQIAPVFSFRLVYARLLMNYLPVRREKAISQSRSSAPQRFRAGPI